MALVIERFEPRGGGMEAVAWQVAHGLAEAGDEVHVVARRAEASDAVQLHPVPVRTGWQPVRVLAFARQASRAAPRRSFDVVHAFSRTLDQDLYRAGGGSHADYLARSHGPVAGRLRRLTPRHAVLLALERRIFGDPTQTIQCVSRRVRDEIAARFGVAPARLRVIYNGVDAQRFHPRSRDEPVAARTQPLWLFAGSGWRRKGLDTALAALAAAREGKPELWVAGHDDPGPWRRIAARLGVEPRVSFLGPRTDVEALYRKVDGLLLPTRYDAFANVCLEAAASGLSVVTSAANGSAELLDGAGAVVADASDAVAFARALDELAEPARRSECGARAREIASRFTWQRHVEEVRALYAELCR